MSPSRSVQYLPAGYHHMEPPLHLDCNPTEPGLQFFDTYLSRPRNEMFDALFDTTAELWAVGLSLAKVQHPPIE